MRKSAAGITPVPNSVVLDPRISMPARCLYVILLAFAQGSNSCAVDQKELARACGCTERAVRNYLGELKEFGLVSWVQRGLNMPNVYEIKQFFP